MGGSSQEDMSMVPTLTQPSTKPSTQQGLTRFTMVVTSGAPPCPTGPSPPYLAQPPAKETVRPGRQVARILTPATTGHKFISLCKNWDTISIPGQQPHWGEAGGRGAEAKEGHMYGVF